MSNNMIRPSNRPASVTLPDNQQGMIVPGMGTRMVGGGMHPGMAGMQQQMSGADRIRAMMSQGIGSSGTGGFNWGSGNGMYEDDALRALRGNTETPDTLTYYIERVAPGIEIYMQQIFHRVAGGMLFEEFKRCREAFRYNRTTGQIDEIRNAFIDDVVKQHEFTKIIALYGAPFFGKYLINIMKEQNRDSPLTQDYLAALNIAVSNVLFFELVSWLNKTQKGKSYALRLTPELASKISNLENFKEVADATYETFGQTSPYASLEFKRPESTRQDLAILAYNMTGYNPQLFDAGPVSAGSAMSQEQYNDIIQMVRRNAQIESGSYQPLNANLSAPRNFDGTPTNWNMMRSDLENLTPQNRNEFKLKRFFHNIGKPNHYFIPETDWKRIQHAFPKHSEMPEEETVLNNCFRIVIIDFEADTGWFSTIVRSPRLDMPTVLTDPSKLLPLLEDSGDLSIYNIHAVKVQDVGNKDKLHIDVETCRKLEAEIPLIAVDEEIVSNSSKEIDSTIVSANNRLTANFSDENATGFKVKTWDTFVCAKPEDRVRLYKDAPFLFKDGKEDDQPSFFQGCRKLLAYFSERIIDDELANFINDRLTEIFNDWLINVMGYSSNNTKDNFLAVDSIITDFREIAEHLKANDSVAEYELHYRGETGVLVNAMKMFTYENPYKETKEESSIMKMQGELELVLERQLYVTVVNKRGGPMHLEANEPVYIKRSKFPEYFQMIERGFDLVMGDEVNPDTTDKLIMFSDSGNIWKFSYSAIDRNVATLRHVSRRQPLVLLPLD